jgi:fructokinase
LLREALSIAHVVKFSHERWAGRGELPGFESNWLQVETLGKDGLRFRSRLPSSPGEGWQRVPGFPVDEVNDAAGSGDWCTAGIVARLCSGGAEGLWHATGEQLLLAFEQGQRLAAWNCGFEGARGGMYGESRRMLAGLTRDLLTARSSLNLTPRRKMPSDPAAAHVEPPLNTGCGSEHCHAL